MIQRRLAETFFIPLLTLLPVCLCIDVRAEEADPYKVKYTHDFEFRDDKVLVKLGDEVFTEYRHADGARPSFYPIIGPTGTSMTRNWPIDKARPGEATDHPHHRSFWFAHGDVNGLDFWTEKNGKAVIRASEQPEQFKTAIVSRNNWLNKDKQPILNEYRSFVFGVYPDGSRVIDFRTGMEPAESVDQVVFGDTKEGTMAIRLHPALRLKGKVATGKAINSEGDRDGAVWGKRAKWVAYWGEIDGKTCGVAIFDNPYNFRHPTWWHARDYGLVAANPFGMTDFEKGKYKRGDGNYTLEQGQRLSLRYRYVFFAGTPQEADISGKYDAWSKHAWTPLFNGLDLTGWHTKPGGQWKAQNNAIVGTSAASEICHGLLVSDKAYKDFRVKLDFKVIEGNSGFYFRSTPVDHAVGMKGFQAELDPTMATGGLYETLGRAWVKKPDPEVMKEHYKPGEWNEMLVHAEGGAIKVWVNHELVVELEDDPGAKTGHFALQLHGGQDMHVMFKDIYIQEIKKD